MTSWDYADEEPTVSRKTAQQIVRNIFGNWAEFVEDMGDKEVYETADVLGWCGY
jgi:hypothetical protein